MEVQYSTSTSDSCSRLSHTVTPNCEAAGDVFFSHLVGSYGLLVMNENSVIKEEGIHR